MTLFRFSWYFLNPQPLPPRWYTPLFGFYVR